MPLEIDVEGSGTVTPDLNGRLLEIGKVYTITARPGPDQIFNGWGGISNAINPVLSFEMKSNLTLVAHFASNPFLTLAGTYTGLYWAMNNISVETSGFLTLQLGKAGSFSGKLSMNGNRYPFRGQFSNLTNATVPVLRRGLKPLVLGLELGPDLITGFVTNAIGTNGNVVVSKLLAQRTTAKSPVPPSQRAFVFQQAGDDSTAPSGNASARINKAGSVQIRGRLSDARKFTLVTGLAQDGSSPFYISPGWGTEAIIGWLLFGEDATSVSGTLFWIKLGSDPIALEVSAGLP